MVSRGGNWRLLGGCWPLCREEEKLGSGGKVKGRLIVYQMKVAVVAT